MWTRVSPDPHSTNNIRKTEIYEYFDVTRPALAVISTTLVHALALAHSNARRACVQ
jgi:hypothetical protein